MPLRLYNTIRQSKEEFLPVQSGKVGIYACGITAYDSCHLGHARAAVVFDVITRYLRLKGYKVRYVRNYTDIDDKIINRSQELGIAWEELVTRYITLYQEDMRSLGVLTPDVEPRATDHIPQMIEDIEKLVKNGYAYEVEESVYFSVRKFPGYGKLSHKNIEELEAGARVEIDELKKDPLDFALWKAAKPGEPLWQSPWGKGRPGWHIECSTMSTRYLGQPFDIHGGGRDLIFPHHENEIAQAEGARGRPFCHYFLHNGFININAEKMSKSKRNFRTVRDVLVSHDSEVVRYFLIGNHYRSPADYTEENLNDAKLGLDRFYGFLSRLLEAGEATQGRPTPRTDLEAKIVKALEGLGSRFQESMDEDFNTAGAIGAIFEVIRIANKMWEGEISKSFSGWVKKRFLEHQKNWSEVLGVLGSTPQAYQGRLRAQKLFGKGIDSSYIEGQIALRTQARAAKDFKKADAIRKDLVKAGVELRDLPDGSTEWWVI